MKRMKYTDDQIERMQAMRNRGMSINAIANYFRCSDETIRRFTTNPKPRKKSTHDRSKAAKKGHQTAKASDDKELDHTVRVLSSVPAGFKAPSRGLGW